jgi:phage major head subunit gpT-like protein
MPVTLSAIKDLLFPGLREVTGKYQQIPRQWDKIFDFMKSEMALERTAENRYLGYAQLKNEGQTTTFDNNAGERFVWNQEHLEIALGYAITRKAIDDNLYKTQFQPSNLGLMESFNQTKEIYAANVLNTGSTYNASVGGDGVSLFNTAHPVDGNSYPNRPSTDVDLNEATLLNAMISIRRTFVDQANLKFFARAKKLVIPPELEPVAIRLLNTELRPGTADNDVNAIRSTAGGLSEGYIVNDYLTSTFAWFLLTNVKGLAYMERIPFETDMQVEFTTDNLLVKGYERYSFGYYNPRAGWGTFPTS